MWILGLVALVAQPVESTAGIIPTLALGKLQNQAQIDALDLHSCLCLCLNRALKIPAQVK